MVALTVPAAAAAQPEAGPAPAAAAVLSRSDAIRLGAERGPGVAVAHAPRAAAHDATRAGGFLVYNPTLQITAGHRTGTVVTGPEVSVTVMQPFSLRGAGGERTALGRAMVRTLGEDVRDAKLQAAARAGLAWVDAMLAREVLRIRTDALAQAEAIAAAARTRVTAGTSAPHEAALARGDAGSARAAMLDAEGQLVEANAELRLAAGVDAIAPVAARGDLFATDDRAIDEALALRLAETQHPALALARARADLASAETRRTHAELGPSLAVGVGYVREGTGQQIWSGILSVPLPLLDAGAFDTARQRGGESAAAAHVDQVRAQLRRDVLIAVHDRVHWREVRDALRAHAVSPLREALRIARAQYESGTQDLSSVLLARQRVDAVEEQLARAAAEVQRSDVRCAAILGTLQKDTWWP